MKINRDGLSGLIQKYLDGTCTPQEKELIDSWFEDENLSLAEGNTSGLDMQEFIWQKIQNQVNAPEQRRSFFQNPFFRKQRILRLAVAASVIVAGSFAFFFLKSKNNELFGPLTENDATFLETNNTNQIRSIHLEEASRVDLRPGSSIRYSKPFAKNKREVFLQGEAFFEVTKNPKRPFIVYAGEVATKVVGTSFIVRSGVEDAQDVEVSVMTGKLIVERKENDPAQKTENNGVVLTPNQKVTFYHIDNHFVTGLVDKPVLVKPQYEIARTHLFRFEETPLQKVLEMLHDAYGVRFELLNDNIRNCPFTADLSGEPLYTKLDIIAGSLNAQYEVKGLSIVLSGGSCD